MIISCDLQKAALFGRSYLTRFCLIQMKQKSESRLFRAYVADTLWAYCRQGKGKRFSDFLEIETDWKSGIMPEESAEQIKERIKNKLSHIGGEMNGDECI